MLCNVKTAIQNKRDAISALRDDYSVDGSQELDPNFIAKMCKNWLSLSFVKQSYVLDQIV